MIREGTAFSVLVTLDGFDHLVRAIDYGGEQGRRVFVEQVGSSGRGPQADLDLCVDDALELASALEEASRAPEVGRS